MEPIHLSAKHFSQRESKGVGATKGTTTELTTSAMVMSIKNEKLPTNDDS